MEDLLLKKREVIEKNLPALMEKVRNTNIEILKLIDGPLKDQKTSFKLQLDILQKFNLGGLEVNHESSNKMDGQQQLEYTKLFFENAKMMVGTLDSYTKKYYNSYIKTIDKQMKLYEDQLKVIDDELKKVDDEAKRKELLEERRNIGVKAS